MSGFIEEISGDWTLKTVESNSLVTIDTGLPGTTLITGDLSIVGNISFAGNGAIVSNTISSGTTSVAIPVASGNVNITVNNVGIANFYSSGLSVAGNVTGSYIYGNGAFLTGLPAQYSNANVAAYLPTYTGNLVSLQGNLITTANISGNYVLGNGAFLTGLYSNANVAAYLPTYTGNLQAGNISITGNGNITGANVISGRTINASQNVVAVGNITGSYFIGNGSQLSGVTAANVGVLDYLSVIGNIDAGNLRTAGVVSAAGNVSASGVVVSGSGGDITGAVNISATGNVTGGNLYSNGFISATGNINGNNISATGNITSGNITGTDLYGANLSLSGNATIVGRIVGNTVRIGTDAGLTNQGIGAIALGINAGSTNQGANSIAIGRNAGDTNQSGNSIILNAVGTSLNTSQPGLYINPVRSDNTNISNVVMYNTGTKELTYASNISLSGNVTAGYFVGNGSTLSNIQASALVGNTLSSNVVYSSLTTVGNLTGLAVNGNVDIVGNLTVTGNANISGNILGDRIVNGTTEVDIEIPGGNVAFTVNSVSNVAVVTPAGINVIGNVSATGNITGNYILGNGALLSGIASSQGLANGTSNVSIPVVNGNVIVSVNGTSNVATFDVTGISLPGNVATGNLLTDNLLYANGQPWDLQQPAGSNTWIQYNDNNNFGASANLTFNTATGVFGTKNISATGFANITGNVAAGGFNTAGAVSATGNVTGGNLVTVGLISSTGNLTSGNINTAGIVSAAGNVSASGVVVSGSGGDITGAVNISATGNVTGGNLVTSGNVSAVSLLASVVSASGNVTGGNILTNGLISTAGNINGNSLSLSGNVVIDGRIQGTEVKIGTDAAISGQGYGAVALGLNAGYVNQGQYAVAIGTNAGSTNQGNNSIVLNASGSALNGTIANALFVNPIRNDTANTANLVFYNATTKEVTYANTISISGNITAGNINGNVSVSNITGSSITITATSGQILLSAFANVSIGGGYINNVASPIQAGDAANKSYVDSVASGLDPKASVSLATANVLPAYTYNNGNVGVGATLTGSSNGTLALDGIDVSAASRVLIKNEAAGNAPYNGIYVVTDAGNLTAPYILTRSTDFDQGTEVPSAFTFVETGNTLADTGWVCNTNSPVVIGTTPINWVQFSGAGTYTAGTGLQLIGTQFSIANTAVTVGTYGSGNAIPTFTVNQQGQLTFANTVQIEAPADKITGNTLSANVLYSSLTTVGTLTSLSVQGNIIANSSISIVGGGDFVMDGGNIDGAVIAGGIF